LPTFAENFAQIRAEVFAQSCEQTDKETNNDENISSLAEVIIFCNTFTELTINTYVPHSFSKKLPI